MPTVLSIGNLRVVIYPNDHRPAHVHVIGPEAEAVFYLNCPAGSVRLRENDGFPARELNRIAQVLNKHVSELCAVWKEIMTITNLEFKQANARTKALKAGTPAATSAYFDRRSGNIIVKLSTGIGIFFSPKDAQGLEDARPAQLNEIEITPSGFGLHFPKLDADLYVPALLEGFLGSRKWMAARLGAAGGSSRSKTKAVAARANGVLGGRPRKVAAR